MKGGVAAMIEAAEMIRRSSVRLAGDVIIACVAGELQAGVGTVYLVEHGPKADAAIVTEPYGKNNILTVHTGVMQFAVHTIGRSRHIALTDPGVDAIAKAAKAREAIHRMEFTYTPNADLPDLPRVRMGAIIGGQGRDYSLKGPQFTSDFCTILGDARFVPGQSVESVTADLRRALAAVKAADPEFEYEIETPPPASLKVGGAIMEPFDLPRDEPILAEVIGAYREVMDREPKTPGGSLIPMSYGGNDTTHLWRAGIPCLLYGPGGEMGNDEAMDHYTRIDDMSVVAKVLATVALSICGGGDGS
jgi:acetylornithine deacetylase